MPAMASIPSSMGAVSHGCRVAHRLLNLYICHRRKDDGIWLGCFGAQPALQIDVWRGCGQPGAAVDAVKRRNGGLIAFVAQGLGFRRQERSRRTH